MLEDTVCFYVLDSKCRCCKALQLYKHAPYIFLNVNDERVSRDSEISKYINKTFANMASKLKEPIHDS